MVSCQNDTRVNAGLNTTGSPPAGKLVNSCQAPQATTLPKETLANFSTVFRHLNRSIDLHLWPGCRTHPRTHQTDSARAQGGTQMKRIAFRMVWIALLAGGMTLLMTPDKNADAENAAENTAEKAPDSLAAAPGEPDAAQGSKSAENSGENTGSDSIDAVPTIDLEAKALATAQDTAWKLLLGLSPKIATIPEPVDTVLGEELSLLAHQDADKKLNLRGKLSEPESAGKFIHDLRKRSFLPASTVKWHSHKIESDRVSELIGSVTLKDGRARAFKAHLDLQTGLVTSYSRPSIQELGGQELVNTVFAQLKAGDAQAVWTQASPELRKHRNAGELLADIQAERLLEAITIEWEKDTAIEGGFRLIGVANLANDETIPFYAALLDSPDGLRLLDVQSTSGFTFASR